MQYMNFLIPYLPALGDVEGCTEEEIKNLEQSRKVQLPAAYKEYLLLFGRKSGYFLQGYYTTIDQIDSNIECIEFDLRTVDHSGSFMLGPEMFLFGQWQGTYFYFNWGGSEDPEVFMITHFDRVKVLSKSFSDFVRSEGLEQIRPFLKL